MAGSPPGDALPPSPRGATRARKCARCGAGAGSPRPHRLHPGHTGRGTLAANSRGRAAGGGTAPDIRRPSQRWQAAPPGTPFRHPHGEQRRPASAHAVGPVLGPHARTDRTRVRRVAEPWLPAPEDGRPGKGQRLTPGAPHNSGRPAPPGDGPRPPPRHTAPTGLAGQGTVLGPHTHTTAPTARGWRTPTACPAGGQLGEGQRLTSDAPHNGGRHPPRGRPSATPTASNAGPQGRTLWGRCWVPTPALTAPRTPGCGTLAARSRGRAAGGGTAPDTRRPSERWQAPPPGTPFRHPHSEQRWLARAHAVGPVLGPHARTNRTRDTRVAELLLPAPEDGWPGEGQRLTPGAPHNGGRPAPRGWPPTVPAARSPHRACRPRRQCWAPTTTHPRPQHVGGGPQQPAQWAGSRGGTAPDLRRPSQRWKARPLGTPFRHPHSEQRRPARAHAVGPVLGPHARTDRTRDTRVAECWLPAPEDGRPGEGQRLTTDAPHNGGRPPPPGTAPHQPRGTQPPQGMQAKGTVLGPHTQTTAPTARGWRTPTARPSGRAVGGGTAPDLRRPSQWWKAPPPGTPFRHPHSEQRWPARAHAVGPVLGPHARTARTRDTRSRNPGCPLQRTGGRGTDSA